MQKRNRGIINEIGGVRGSFAVVFFCMFVLCVAFLSAADALPQVPHVQEELQSIFAQEHTENVELSPAAPVRVVADSIGLDVSVSNPESAEIAVLDEALLLGAARYPTSALLGVEGTVLLFGHSSNLPIVQNRNYKAFNGIQKLKEGSIVSVYSATHEFRYKVTGVRVANAQEDVIELRSDGRFLTLVTCDLSFASKTSRYVVTAEFVEAFQTGN